MPPEAWGVIGLAVGGFLHYMTTRSTNAATIAQQNRQDDRAQIERMLANKDADLSRLRDDLRAERELRAMEQARADRYLAQLLEDERAMHRAADELNKQTGGAS